MRSLALLAILCITVVCASCQTKQSRALPERVLFIGNSLTYAGNLPAVYAAVATANGHPTDSDMIVRGGATLAQRVADGSAARALATGKYSAVILQERGGDLICSFGPASCVESKAAIKTLADLARRHRTRVVLLGTYQPRPDISRALVEKESAAADAAEIPYIEISEMLQRLRRSAPELTWFAADGMHPGKDLTLLDAVLVYRALHGALPKPAPLTVMAPIYDGANSGLDEALRRADAPPPLPETPGEIRYAADILEVMIGSADND